MLTVKAPQNRVFLTDDSVFAHDPAPVLWHLIDVDVPEGPRIHRVSFIRDGIRQKPLYVVLYFLRLLIQE